MGSDRRRHTGTWWATETRGRLCWRATMVSFVACVEALPPCSLYPWSPCPIPSSRVMDRWACPPRLRSLSFDPRPLRHQSWIAQWLRRAGAAPRPGRPWREQQRGGVEGGQALALQAVGAGGRRGRRRGCRGGRCSPDDVVIVITPPRGLGVWAGRFGYPRWKFLGFFVWRAAASFFRCYAKKVSLVSRLRRVLSPRKGGVLSPREGDVIGLTLFLLLLSCLV